MHSVLETAVAHVPGTLTSFLYHLPIAVRVLSSDCCPFYRKKIVLCLIAHVAQWQRLNGSAWGAMQAQELLADIAVLEVAVLKLKEKSTALRSQVGQERTEHETAELYRERPGPILQPKGQGSPVPPPSPQQMIICADSQCNRPSHALVTPEQPEFRTATSVQDDKMFPCSPSSGHLWKVSPLVHGPCMFMLFSRYFWNCSNPNFADGWALCRSISPVLTTKIFVWQSWIQQKKINYLSHICRIRSI